MLLKNLRHRLTRQVPNKKLTIRTASSSVYAIWTQRSLTSDMPGRKVIVGAIVTHFPGDAIENTDVIVAASSKQQV